MWVTNWSSMSNLAILSREPPLQAQKRPLLPFADRARQPTAVNQTVGADTLTQPARFAILRSMSISGRIVVTTTTTLRGGVPGGLVR